MLIIDKSKVVALNLKNPNRVLDAIPTARTIEVRGSPLVIAPHRLDEVKVLRNLGIKAPSPILHYYDWPGKFTPFEHQRQTAAFLTLHNKCLVLNEIGTGKTQAALWAADYLLKTKKVRRVLILSPLSTLERVWGDGIFMGFVHRKFVVLHGTAQRRHKLLKRGVADGYEFFIVNHDGFPIVANELNDKIDLVIVDEAAVYRNPSTTRYKLLKKWMDNNPATRLWLMTGTPTPNEPTDAWALAKLVESPALNRTYTAFREMVMMKIGQWKFVPRPEALRIVWHVLQPAVRYTREECFDLPDTIIQSRKVELTAEQNKHYKQMLKHFVTEAAQEGTITAVNEAVKIQKLVQIACGVAYGDDGQNIEIDCSPRINIVKEVIEEAGEKVIVFVPLTGTLHMLERELSKHWTVAVVNGEVSASKRNTIFHNFQHATDPRVLIAHPGTMAHGLTLTAATTIIWYGPINSNEIYGQANGRIERIGKNRVSNLIHIEATELEHRMYERLKNKEKLQGLLLDLIQETTRDQ
jgi:SNF2 family DNA or RNA helicase